MKTKISRQGRVSLGLIIILIVLVGLNIGGFFIYQNISRFEIKKPVVEKETEVPPVAEEKLEEISQREIVSEKIEEVPKN